MIIRLKLTKDHLKLIQMIFINNNEDEETVSINKDHMYSLGSHLLEDISYVLGMRDRAIKGTEEDPDGCAFSDEDEKYMLEIHQYIVDNLYYIETLIHQFVTNGGISEGTYKAQDNDLIWSKEE